MQRLAGEGTGDRQGGVETPLRRVRREATQP